MNIQLERIENEASTGHSIVLCCHWPRGTEESHGKSVRIVCVLAKTENKHLRNTRSFTVSGNMLGMSICRIDIHCLRTYLVVTFFKCKGHIEPHTLG